MTNIDLDALPASALLDRKEAADALRVSGASVRRYERSLDLKSIKLSPRVIRYKVADLRAFIARSDEALA